jgi:S-adenosylmethionine:tRNA ribosyltransferase-isomerase
MLQQGKVYWQCLVGGASKWKHGQVLAKEVNNGELTLHASYIEKKAGSFVIELSWTPSHLSFAEVLHYAGAIPLPPYIKRDVEELDKTRYQTIYAQLDGSVAAPTAGLHFTDTIFKQLDEKKIHTDFVTLHVGAGTFKPVKAATMKDHGMHAEYIDVSRKTIENLLKHLNDPIIAVGTTSLRTIESLYWLGRQSAIIPVVLKASPTIGITAGNQPTVGQWEPYESNSSIPPKEALLSLLDQMDKNKTERLLAKTQIIIAPGYKPRIVKGVITNFHQPQSTLLLLVAALIGADWKKVYDHALQHGFRFLSYGDGCLLWTKE